MVDNLIKDALVFIQQVLIKVKTLKTFCKLRSYQKYIFPKIVKN